MPGITYADPADAEALGQSICPMLVQAGHRTSPPRSAGVRNNGIPPDMAGVLHRHRHPDVLPVDDLLDCRRHGAVPAERANGTCWASARRASSSADRRALQPLAQQPSSVGRRGTSQSDPGPGRRTRRAGHRRQLPHRTRPHRRQRRARRAHLPVDHHRGVRRASPAPTPTSTSPPTPSTAPNSTATTSTCPATTSPPASRCRSGRTQRRRRRRRLPCTPTPVRACTASSTRSTARCTSTRSSKPPTPSGCSRASTSPTSRPPSTSPSPHPRTGRSSPTARPTMVEPAGGRHACTPSRTTPRMSTYLVALIAGPYARVATTSTPTSTARSRSGIFCRASLARVHGRRAAVHRDQTGIRLLPQATSARRTRSASTTSCSCRSSTPAPWRTPAR